jgi:hypothetical protein
MLALTVKQQRTILIALSVVYLGGYALIRSRAVHFPVTPGSVGYAPNQYRETVILQPPVAPSQRLSASMFAVIYFPVLALDYLVCGSHLVFQASPHTLPDFQYPSR